ncbi:TPA: hypothetical protein EYP38_02605, partial [Candidatus Micrarchaeota archaeon]|nr:hypothetical protein [Candidatus Micrarchaeota archaeon]
MARYGNYRQATRCPLPPRYVLLIAEKPKAGYMIATALSGGRARKCYYKGAPFWIFNIDGQGVVVAPAAGHLYGLCAKEDGYPVFEYEWRPLWLIERGSNHLERFFSMLSYVSRRASV